MLRVLQIFVRTLLMCGVFLFVFLSLSSHESSAGQSYVQWKEAFTVGWKRWYQRWPPQIRHDLRATPSPMTELDTKASMVQGLRFKSRDPLGSEQSLMTGQTRAYIFVSICLNPIVPLCLLVTCCLCNKPVFSPLRFWKPCFFTSQRSFCVARSH